MNTQEYLEKINQIVSDYPVSDIPKFVNNLENIKNLFSKISPATDTKVLVKKFIIDAKKRIVETSGMTETQASSTVMRVYKYLMSAVDTSFKVLALWPISWIIVFAIVINYKLKYPHRKITPNVIFEAAKLYIYKTNLLWAKNESKGLLEKGVSMAIVPYVFYVIMYILSESDKRSAIFMNVTAAAFMTKYLILLINLSTAYLRQIRKE